MLSNGDSDEIDTMGLLQRTRKKIMPPEKLIASCNQDQVRHFSINPCFSETDAGDTEASCSEDYSASMGECEQGCQQTSCERYIV